MLDSYLEDFVLDALPDRFVVETVHTLAASYAAAAEECRSEYPPSEALSLEPLVRRANIEVAMRGLAGKFGIEAEPRPSGGAYYHSVLLLEKLVLTIAVASSPQQVVRKTNYRKNYARTHQLDFINPRVPPRSEPETLSVILLHGPRKNDKRFLDFVRLVVPDGDMEEYLASVNLLIHCQERGEQPYRISDEEIQLAPAVTLKKAAMLKLRKRG